MAKTITIQTKTGDRVTPVVWKGQSLAVHRPPSSKDPSGFSQEARHWAITHHPSGLAACFSFDGAKNDAIALAKLWDGPFGELDPKNPCCQSWRWSAGWLADCRAAEDPIQYGKPVGPILPDHPTPKDVAAAVTTAVCGAPSSVAGGDPEPDPDGPAPTDYVAPGKIRTGKDGWPELRHCGKWYAVPTLAELESYLFDSIADGPLISGIEPDHPESWPALLGMI